MKSGRSGRLRRFHGKTVSEAMLRLKSALGQNGIIVSVKKGRKQFLGLFGPRLVEITASADDGTAKVYQPGGKRLRRRVAKRASAVPERPAPATAAPSRAEPALPARATTRRLRRELDGIKHLEMDLILQGKENQLDYLPGAWREWYQHLQELGLSRKGAQSLVLRLTQQPGAVNATADQVAEQIKDGVVSRLPLADPIRPTKGHQTEVAVLVGPPGVGKTTAIMKLAAQLARSHRGTVGLLSLDTARIGAAESLESCAQLLGVPFQAAADRQEVGICLSTLGDLSLILVDTPGCSPNNSSSLDALMRLISGLGTAQFHLALSASDSRSFLQRTIDAYEPLEPASVLVTKLDETDTPAILVEMADKLPGGVSHLSFGQSIPHDLRPATRESLTELLFVPFEAVSGK